MTGREFWDLFSEDSRAERDQAKLKRDEDAALLSVFMSDLLAHTRAGAVPEPEKLFEAWTGRGSDEPSADPVSAEKTAGVSGSPIQAGIDAWERLQELAT